MKSKIKKNPAPEINQDDAEDVEIEAGGPAIAAAKKGKIAVIAASSILITVVIYFLFFKGEGKKQEKLEEVAPPPRASFEGGRSPFEAEKLEEKPKEDIDLLAKPATPEIPTLPDLPAGSLPMEDISLAPEQPKAVGSEAKTSQAAVAEEQKAEKLKPVIAEEKVEKKEDRKELDPRYAPIIVLSGGEGPARGVGYENNIVQLNQDPINKLQKTKAAIQATYIEDRTHVIAQGKLLTAVLETAINTEIPGFVRAVISRDVFGESGNQVLIPKGSRLFGSYSSQITRGQGRVEIGWTRLIRSDGVDLAIGFTASDQFGRAGIAGEVDNKYSSVITNSLLTSILAIGGVAAAQKLLTNNTATTTTTNPQQGTTTTTGSATNQALYDVSKTIIDTVGQVVGNSIDIKPTIRVPQGTRITVIVNSDINVPSMSKK